MTLRAWLRDLPYGMLTTRRADGALDGRPLQTLDIDDAGRLWFFTARSSLKAAELAHDARVSLAYCDPQAKRFVCIAGQAALLQDRARAAALWSAAQTVFYPRGIDDPDLALLRVTAEHARAWDGNEPWLGLVQKFGKAVLRGEAADLGRTAQLDLRRAGAPAVSIE